MRTVLQPLEAQGIKLSDCDAMIAAHAVSVDDIAVNRDKAFVGLSERLKAGAAVDSTRGS